MFAFSSSKNFIEVLSFRSSSRGATPSFVFNLPRTCAQNGFGFVFDDSAIDDSNFLLDLRINDLALFDAFLNFSLAATVSPLRWEDIHWRWVACFSWIAFFCFSADRKSSSISPFRSSWASFLGYKFTPQAHQHCSECFPQLFNGLLVCWGNVVFTPSLFNKLVSHCLMICFVVDEFLLRLRVVKVAVETER